MQREQKIRDLSVLFINMHHLINEFRPHQARETLCVIMERQRKQREEMIIQVQRLENYPCYYLQEVVVFFIHRATDKAKSILKDCADNLAQAVAVLPPSDPAVRQTAAHEDAMDTSTAAPNMVGVAL